jgi:hypothetical protein
MLISSSRQMPPIDAMRNARQFAPRVKQTLFLANVTMPWRPRGQVARPATAQYVAIRFSTCPDPRTERDGHKGQSPFRHRAAARP